jgi:hypothetical protein
MAMVVRPAQLGNQKGPILTFPAKETWVEVNQNEHETKGTSPTRV